MDPMVSADPALYDPTSFGNVTDEFLPASGTPPNLPGVPSSGSGLLGGIGSGLTSITELLQVVAQVLPSVEEGIKDAQKITLGDSIKGILAISGKIGSFLDALVVPIPGTGIELRRTQPGQLTSEGARLWEWFTEHTLGEFYTGMLEVGLGVDTSLFDDDANKGRQTVDHMLGFAFLSAFIVPCIGLIGKLPLAGRWIETALTPLAEIPQEMGLSWAMGLEIDEAFKTAVGMSIEEGINRQKRGNRIGWPQLRTMLKQHIFEDLTIDAQGKVTGTVPTTTSVKGEHVLRGLLENQGFPDYQIDMLMALSDQLLPVGDVQQLYLRGEMSLEDVGAYITKLGFNDQDRDRLVQLYVSKAETEATVTLRSTARSLFQKQLMGEQQYRDTLTTANYPQREIDADVQAVQLLHQAVQTETTIASIKANLQHQATSADEAIVALRGLGLPEEYITELIQAWQMPASPKPRGLTQGQILRYTATGLILQPDAYTKLLYLGVNKDDALFLSKNPTAASGVHAYHLTPGLVTQAYVQGAIEQQDLSDSYKKAGVKDDALQRYVDAAIYKKAHHRGTSTYTQTLPLGKILDAYKFNVMDYHTAIGRVQDLGFSGPDADILMEIENKGPFHGLDTIPFSTVDEALGFMTRAGYTIIPPPDPRLVAAEGMAHAAGYTWLPPVQGPLPPVMPPA